MTRGPGHYHPELWGVDQQHRYEDRIKDELEKLEKAVDRLTQRVTMLLGGIGLLVFVIPIVSPWVRSFVGIP
jgi:hypothetical protein